MSDFSERDVIRVWQHLLLRRAEVVTEEGEQLRIIYAGRANDDRGADFRDAVIATRQGLAKGDIEVHISSSAWQAHRHHKDPVYNRVILHVVMWCDNEAGTSLQNGRRIPTLALNRYSEEVGGFTGAASGMPCMRAAKRLSEDMVARFLDGAGEKRFLSKTASFRAELAGMEANQSLYLGIMGALGYSRNKLPFMELARRLPLQALESAVEDMPDEECLAQQQAALFGTAGMLPSQRWGGLMQGVTEDDWVCELERRWSFSPHSAKAMSPDDWHLFKVRPSNSPVRRIAAASRLLLRFRGKGLSRELVNSVEEAFATKDHHRLEGKLVVAADGYWADHLDFGLSIRGNEPALLGMGQAANIAVNVILPFTFAWGRLVSRPELAEQSLALYRHHPRLPANAVERHMRAQLGLGTALVNSARRQQGLIHIYNTLCIQGKCGSCVLGQSRPA